MFIVYSDEFPFYGSMGLKNTRKLKKKRLKFIDYLVFFEDLECLLGRHSGALETKRFALSFSSLFYIYGRRINIDLK